VCRSQIDPTGDTADATFLCYEHERRFTFRANLAAIHRFAHQFVAKLANRDGN
jgi:hypothetical protein